MFRIISQVMLFFIVSIIGQVMIGLAVPIDFPALAFGTTSDLSYALSPIAPPVRGVYPEFRNNGNDANDTWTLKIDDTSSGYKQTIDGFGACVTDATVDSFHSLPQQQRDELLAQLLTSLGADFSLMRHTIGASDLSGDPVYTYDDSNGEPDISLLNFGLGDRGEAMASLLATMKAVNTDLRILGSPWSPPGWMKINGVIDGNTTNNNLNDLFVNQSTTDYSSQFAEYFVKYIQAFEQLGATIDAITIQNEPLNSNPDIPSMYVFANESAQLVQSHVGPALASAKISTKVWAYDHNTDVPSYPQTVLDGGSFVDTVAWHCYANPLDWTVLSEFHNNNPIVRQYMTECWTPPVPAVNWWWAADFTMGPLQNWASGVMAWTLGTNSSLGPYLSSGGCHNCQGLVTIEDDGGVTYQLSYYLMAQFSKFIPKGAIVLSGSGSGSDSVFVNNTVQGVATLNPDGTRSVVILNTNNANAPVSLSMTSGQIWSGVIPPESVVTWLLPPLNSLSWLGWNEANLRKRSG